MLSVERIDESTADTPAQPAAPSGGRPNRRWLLLVLAVLLIFPLVAMVWLVASESGLRSLAQWSETLSGGRLALEGARGSLLSGPRFARLRFEYGETRIVAQDAVMNWSGSDIAGRRLVLRELSAAELEIAYRGSDEAARPPASLQLPFALSLDRLALGRLRVLAREGEAEREILALRDVAAALHSDGVRHRLDTLSFSAPWGRFEGGGDLDGSAPFALAAQGNAQGEYSGRTWSTRARFSGALEDLAVELDAESMELTGHATARIAPFAPVPLGRLQARVSGIDPASLQPGAPRAALTLEADLRPSVPAAASAPVSPTDWVLRGPITVTNGSPGLLDRGELPLRGLEGRVLWQAGRLSLDGLTLSLPGKSRGTGSALWDGQALEAKLDLSELNLRELASNLQSTRLAGRLRAVVSARSQQVSADLREPRFTAKFEAEHRDGTIELSQARIDARGAGLEGRGRLALGGKREFAFNGALRRFDPSLFAKVPAARLNARIEARGSLQPQPSADASFTLDDSRLDGKPVAGRGRLALRPGRLENVDLDLDLAGNRLLAKGAFGQPGDRLQASVDAPRLANLGYGLSGKLKGEIEASGGLDRPSFGADLAADSLVIAGYRLAAATLKGELRDGAAGRFTLRGEVRGLQAADAPNPLLAGATLDIGGTRGEHALHVTGKLGAGQEFLADAAGGLDQGMVWAGSVQALEIRGKPDLRLAAPVPLKVAPQRVSLGRAQLRGGEARISLRETEWTPKGLVSSGELSGLNLGIAFDAQQRPIVTADGLQLGAEWALHIADHVNGNVRVFREAGDLSLAGDAPVSLGLKTFELRANAEQDRIGWSVEAAGSRLGELSGSGTVLVERGAKGWQLAPEAQLAGAVRAQMPSIAWLGPWLDPGLQLEGALRGEFAITGRGSEPQGQGSLRGEKLAVSLVEYGTRLTDGELHVAFDRERLKIERLRFISASRAKPREGRIDYAALTATPGELTAQGEFQLATGQGELKVKADRLGVVQRPERWLMMSGAGEFASHAAGMELKATVKADGGYWELARQPAPSLASDVVVKGRTPSDRRRLPLSVDVLAQLGDAFYFSGRGLKSRLAGELRVRGDARGALRGSGSIRTRGGSFDAYGQQLAIERGIVNFQGPLDNPGLNVVALRKNLPVEAGVAVTGTVLNPQVRLVSEPNVPDAEKLSWIVLGRGQDQAGGADAGLLMAAAGAILGGEGEGISAQLARGLGLDELSVTTAAAGASQSRLPGTTVAGSQSGRDAAVAQQILTLGKRLSANAQLSFEQSLAGAESIVKITYHLSRRLSLIGRAGTENSIDLFYTYSFK